MRNLIQRVRGKVKPYSEVVLIVDCVKSRRNWRLGVLVNSWQEQMDALVQELAWDNLKVLSAVGRHQVNEYSPGLLSTSFGHFLKLGLAGKADDDFETTTGAQGNNDGYVSLKELEAYLRFNVSQWCKSNNGDLQEPELISSSSGEIVLAKSLNDPSSVETVTQTSANPKFTLEDIGSRWRMLERLKKGDLRRIRPHLIPYFENRLIHLEQLYLAGKTSMSAAKNVYQQLKVELDRALKEFELVKLPKLNPIFDGVIPRSIRASEVVGLLSEAEADKLRADFQNISESSTELTYLVGKRQGKSQKLESFIGRWLNRLNQAEVWPNSEASAEYAKIHLLSEEAGLPDDIRCHPWSLAELDRADQARRTAFDYLFIGGPTAKTKIAEATNAYEEMVTNGESFQNRVKSFFQLRDRAVAQFIPLADWHTRWHSPTTKIDEGNWQAALDENKLRLSDLAKRLQSHSQLLGLPSSEENITKLEESHEEIDRELNRLRKEFDNYCGTLLSQSTFDGGLVFELKAVLRSPLIPADKRIELLQKLQLAQIRLSDEAQDNLGGPASTSSRSSSSKKTDRVDMERLADRLAGEVDLQSSLTLNPLLVFFDIPTSSSDGSTKSVFQLSAEVNQKIRRCSEREYFVQFAKTLANDLGIPEENKPRIEKHLAAYLQRQSFAFNDSRELEFDFIRELQTFELQQAFLWQAERAALDFFGRIPGRTKGPDSNFVFEVMARSYLGMAKEIDTLLPPAKNKVEKLESDLTQLEKTAESTVQLNVVPNLEMGANQQNDVKIQVSSEEPKIGPKAISGTIAVHLESNGSQKWGPGFENRYPALKPPESKSLPVDNGEYHQVVAFFRGHQVPNPVISSSLAGHHHVEILDKGIQKSDVTLIGDRMGPSSVMFVLDCSQSMSEAIKVELIGEKKVPRLQLAKGAMATMLDILAQRKDTRVGVRFFGHRSGWSTSDTPVKLQQKSYARKIPDALAPENDVELALPLGRFTSSQAGQIKTVMQSIAPWGQSPLNLALVQAMDDFELEEQGTQKSIVVITDGLNYQFSPNSEVSNNSRITSVEDVLSKVTTSGIPIYILGFGISQKEEAEAARSFYSIASKSGGKYFPVKSGKELLQRMREKLQLGTYNVFDSDNKPIVQDASRLNRLYNMVDLPGAGKYRLTAESTEQMFNIEGGESLLFKLTEGPTISSIPYDEQVLERQILSRNDRSEKIVFRAHRPKQIKDGVEFKLSFQFQNVPFTPRPKDIWVEISPIFESEQLPEKQSSRYVFYDLDFEMRKPVPVVSCKVATWPESAKRAQIKVYCKFKKSIPTQLIPVSELEQWKSVDGFPGMRCRIEVNLKSESSIRIVERHDSGSKGIYSNRVDLLTAKSLRPVRIFRQFDTENNVAFHDYYYDAKTIDEIVKSADAFISVTGRQVIESEAWKANEPVEVRIYPEVELLPLDAATGVR